MENNDELDRFIRDILEAKKLAGVDEEVREQLVSDLKSRLLDQIDRAVIGAIPDNRIDGFNELLDKSDTTEEAIRDYVARSGVDIQRVTVDTMLTFRSLYLTPPELREA